MPASQIDDQIIIQKSPWENGMFSIAAKSSHPKGPFIAEIVGLDQVHGFKRIWLGSRSTKAAHGVLIEDTSIASFDMIPLVTKPRILHIRAAAANYYLLYADLMYEPILYPIFSKTEVTEWLIAKQLWYAVPSLDPQWQGIGAIAPGTMVTVSTSAVMPYYNDFVAANQKPKKLPPARLHIEPPAGKRRIKLD